MRLLLLLLTILPITSVCGQELIKFDFSTKKFTPAVQALEEDKYYQLKIEKINQNLYEITVGSSDTVTDTAAKLPTFADLNVELLKTVTEAIGAVSTTVGNAKESEIFDLSEESDQFKIDSSTTEDLIVRYSDALSNMDILTVSSDYQGLQLEIIKHNLLALQKQNSRDTLTLFRILSEYEEMVEDIDEQLLESQILEAEIKSSITLIDKKEKEALLQLNQMKAAAGASTAFLKDVRSKLSISSFGTALKEAIFLDNNRANTYTSMPLYFDGDEANIEFTIKPRANIPGQTYTGSYPMKRANDKYVATGLSLYIAILQSDSYSNQAIESADSTSYRLVDEENNSHEMGIASMLHFGMLPDESSYVGYHVGVGVGLSVGPKVRPRLLFGGGLAVGKRHKLVLNIGGVAGYVDRLSMAVDLESTYRAPVESSTVAKLQVGFFGSVGYLYTL